MFSKTFPAWGSMRSGGLWQRLTWGPRTSEDESFFWRTPTMRGHHPAGLENRTKHIPTIQLAHQVNMWSTPQAFDSNACERSQEARERALTKGGCRNLREDVLLWPTPKGSAENYGQPRENDRGDLQAAASLFPTPRSCSGLRSSGANRTELLRRWASPAARDWKSGQASEETLERNARPLNEQVCSLPVPPTGTPGSDTSPTPRTLNPRFVEALMGFPAEWTVCDVSVTRSFRWLQQSRSEFCRIVSGSDR